MYKFLFWLATFALAFNAYRPWAANVSISDALYVAAMAALLMGTLARRRPGQRFHWSHPFWLPSVLILFGGLIASFGSGFQLASIRVSLTQFYIFTVWLALGIWMSRAGELEMAVTALIAGSTVACLFAIVDFVFGLRTGLWFVTNPNLFERTFWYRTGGSLGNPNELALYSAVVIPIVLDRLLHLFSDEKQAAFSSRALLYSLCFIILAAGLIFSGSATGIVGVLISGLVILTAWLFARPSRHSIRLLAWRGAQVLGFLAVAGFLAHALYPEYAEKVAANLAFQNTFLRATGSSIATRAEFLRKGLDLLFENPFWGYGMDQTGTGGLSRDASQYLTDLYIHNTVIQMWFGGGLFALTGALLLYWRGLKLAWQGVVLYVRGAAPAYVLGLAASTVSWILMDQVQANIYQRFKWLVVALLVGQLHRLQAPQPAQVDRSAVHSSRGELGSEGLLPQVSSAHG